MARKIGTKWIRFGVQAFFLILVVFKAVQHMVGDTGTVASLDGLCPLGGIETLGRLVGAGRYLDKLAPSNIILIVGLLVTALLAGGVFCGWICPFGTISDWLTALRRKIGIREVLLAGKLDRWLRHVRYVVLLAVLGVTFYTGKLIFADYDPYRTVFSLHWIFSPSDLAAAGVVITAIVLIAMFFIPRAWCRYTCPLGGLLSIVGRFRVFRVVRKEEGCTHCALCDFSCPMGLSVSETGKNLSQCNACLKCADACPAPEALTVSAGRRRPVGKAWPIVAGIGILVIAVAGSMAAGLWVSGQRQTVERQVSAGTLSPEDIRGWMTFADVEKAFGVPVADLLRAAGSPAGFDADTSLRELESSDSGEDLDVIRDFVADYLKKHGGRSVQPAPASGKTPEPQSSDDGAPETGVVPPVTGESLGTAEKEAIHQPAAVEGSEPEVRGTMTLNDIAVQFGASVEKLIERLGLPKDVDRQAALRDIGDVYGFDMTTVRELVEELRIK